MRADTTPAQRVAGEVRAEIARQRRSQAEVFTVLGISRPAWSRRLRGEIAFDVGELIAIAEILDVSPDRFLAVVERPTAVGQ